MKNDKEDLEEEIDRFFDKEVRKNLLQNDNVTLFQQIRKTAIHFAEYKKKKENDFLRTFDEEFKRYFHSAVPYDKIYYNIARHFAEWQKQQMKETLQTEYEKGLFDMREEMMKDAVEGEIGDIMPLIEVGEMNNYLNYVKAHKLKIGDKVKIIIVKEKKK